MQAWVSDMQWVLAQGRTATHPFLLRFCELPADFPRQRFPLRLNVFWKLARPTTDGMPSSQDLDRLEAFEEHIIAATERDGIAVLPLVLTGRGQREYVFQVRSTDDFLQRLNDMQQESDPYPIEIHEHEDADWTYFDNEVGAVKTA